MQKDYSYYFRNLRLLPMISEHQDYTAINPNAFKYERNGQLRFTPYFTTIDKLI